MGIFGQFMDLIYHKIFGFLSSEDDLLAALDIQKWGTPVSEGEAHYINEIVKKEHLQKKSSNSALGSALEQAQVYKQDLQSEFGLFRRGWVVEYIGDAFCPNAFQRSVFIFLCRFPILGPLIINIALSLQRVGNPNTQGGPKSFLQKLFVTLFWLPFTFHFGTAVLGGLIGLPAVLAAHDPLSTFVGQFILGQLTVLLVFTYAFTKWHGKYGLYIPGLGTQNFGSAVASVAMFALTIVVVFRLMPFVDLSNIAFTVTAWDLPNPLLLGLGHFMEGLIVSDAWGAILMLWGLSGVGNIFYGEWAESKTEENELYRKLGHKFEKELKKTQRGIERVRRS